ncbi:MAG: DUF2442 domain-containing protein, partial [Synergistaceae bacterium]|nr:DUF2442 domain-containing protein [Synergistaceae bacterium]
IKRRRNISHRPVTIARNFAAEMIRGTEEMLPRAAAVEVIKDYNLVITFKNGKRKKYDAKHLFSLPMYKNLAKVFSLAKIEHGTVVWPGDLDISPNTLYLRSIKI